MLFHKKSRESREKDLQAVELKLNHRKVSDIYFEKIKPLERKQKIKHYFVVCLVAIGLFGGFKALLPGIDDQEALAVSETQTFVKTYATNYFMYPKSEDTEEYFKSFSLDPLWEMQYDNQKIKSATVSNVEIYKVNPDKTDSNYADYYLYLSNRLTMADDTESDITYHVKVRLYKNDESYLVTAPIEMRALEIQSVADEEKDALSITQNKGSEQVDETKKEELMNTLSLFLDTYSSNYDQAQLLVDMDDNLDEMDEQTKMEMDSISSVSKDADTYYIEAMVIETLSDIITNRKKIHFEIDIEKNKITEMEEY